MALNLSSDQTAALVVTKFVSMPFSEKFNPSVKFLGGKEMGVNVNLYTRPRLQHNYNQGWGNIVFPQKN